MFQAQLPSKTIPNFSLSDAYTTALEIKEGSNVYLQFDTSNGQEGIFAKKEFEFQAGANMDDNQKFKFATDEADTGASGSLGSSQTTQYSVLNGSRFSFAQQSLSHK